MAERDVTIDEARVIIAKHGGYGTVRVYGIITGHPDLTGQITGIKSEHHLTEYEYSRLYAVGNGGTGMPPIRRA